MINIRKGKKKDIPFVLELIKELATFENAEVEVDLDIDVLENDAFGPEKFFNFLVAEIGGKIIGMALYYPKYSTWKGRCFFLEDLIVSKDYRNQGVGTKLFETLIKMGRKNGINRLMWQVLDWNQSAINFYKKFDATISSSWLDCKLDKNQINNYPFD